MELSHTDSSPSIFDRAHAFFAPGSDYEMVNHLGLYPYFRAIERNEGTRAIIHGREVIMAGSNNYLGLTSDPRVKEAAKDTKSVLLITSRNPENWLGKEPRRVEVTGLAPQEI